MSTILIVDDEKWIREGIKVKLKRLGYRPTQIAEACNGIEALEVMRQYPFDIVMSDIRMDEMDGLKLCEVLKKEFPETQKVIICGYSEFDYAAKAIELGVVSYLLKPISFEELEKAVGLCEENIAKIGDRRQFEEISKLERIYLYGRQYEVILRDRETIRNVLTEYRDDSRFVGFYFFIGRNIVLSPWKILQVLENGSAGYTFEKNLLLINKSPSEYIALYLLKSGNKNMQIQEISKIRQNLSDVLEKNSLWDFSCGISEPDTSPFHAVYNACEAMHHKVIYPDMHFIEKELVEKANINYLISDTDKLQLTYSVREKDYTTYSEILQKIQRETNEVRISYDSLERLYHIICSILEDTGSTEEKEEYKNALYEDVWKYHSSKDIYRALKEWGLSTINISSNSASDRKEQMIRKLKEYIDTYYYEDITLEQMAKCNFVSISYLSTAFRDIVGMNFQEYLNAVRLTTAKRLLLEKNYKVGTIAGMVGFSDQHYFSRVFKKYEGCTPKEYIEKVRS